MKTVNTTAALLSATLLLAARRVPAPQCGSATSFESP
jgi:hypothetical protein